MQKKRLSWLDSLKGIGIFLVLLGHAPISTNLHYYIYAFHMPLFFFASGYLFDAEKYQKFKNFFIKKFKSLILPYIYFSAISIALYVFYARFGETKEALNFKETLIQFVFAKRNNIPYNKALWFFPALFTISLIYFLLKKYIKDNLAIISIALILSFAGYSYFKTLIEPKLFWTLDSSIYYLIFYAAGSLTAEKSNVLNKKINRYSVYLFFAIALAINISIIWNAEIFEQIKFYSNTLLFGFAGITALSLFSKLILEKLGKADIFKYLGRNSLAIFALHQALCYPVIGKAFSVLNINIQNSNLLGLSFAVLSIIMLAPIIYVINNFLPFLLGKNSK